MKPFTKIAMMVFGVICAFHILRLIMGWEADLDRMPIPMWISGVGALVSGLLAVMLWKENK